MTSCCPLLLDRATARYLRCGISIARARRGRGGWSFAGYCNNCQVVLKDQPLVQPDPPRGCAHEGILAGAIKRSVAH